MAIKSLEFDCHCDDKACFFLVFTESIHTHIIMYVIYACGGMDAPCLSPSNPENDVLQLF